MILQAGKIFKTKIKNVIELREGERLLGIKSNIVSNLRQSDIIFVIGR